MNLVEEAAVRVSKFLWSSVISLAVYCVFCSPSSYSKAINNAEQSRPLESNQKEWVLEQKQQFLGRLTIFLTANAVKIMAPDSHVQIMAQGPDWKVHCANLKDKTEWIGTIKEFNGACLTNPFAFASLNTRSDMRATEFVKMSGLNCIKYQSFGHSQDKILTSRDIAVNPKCAEVLYRYYDLRCLPEVPVYAIHFQIRPSNIHKKWPDDHPIEDLRDGAVISLATKSCKQQRFNAADFAAPQHFRRLPLLVEVGYTKTDQTHMTDIIENIGYLSDDAHISKIKPKSAAAK